MRFGSLFSGIGGIDLGLERAGMTCAWQVEIDPYARAVLAKHWPNVRRFHDVRSFPPALSVAPDADLVDVIVGGPPCVDISNAHTNGEREGLDGEQSGLWQHMHSIIDR